MARLIKRTFSPGYEADDQKQYDELARLGAESSRAEARRILAHPGDRTQNEIDAIRDRMEHPFQHVQVRGGRKGLSSSIESPEMSRTAAFRLRDRQPDWQHRTQGLGSIEAWILNKGRPVREALKALAETQGNSAGVYIPQFIGPLVDHGMSRNNADLLVRRAGGSFIAFSSLEQIDTSVPVPTLAGEFLRVVGSPLQLLWTGEEPGLYLPIRGQGALNQVRIRAISPRYANKSITKDLGWTAESISFLLSDWISQTANARAEIESLRRSNEPVPESLFPIADRREENLGLHFLDLLEKEGRKLAPNADLTYSLFFGPGKFEVQITLSILQHSVGATTPASSIPVRYRTLEGVSHQDLPALVTKLSRRKRKVKGTKAKENPMYGDDLDWIDHLTASDSALVPTRSNAGRPRRRGLKVGAPGRGKYARMTLAQLKRSKAKGAKAEIARRKRALAKQFGKAASRKTRRSSTRRARAGAAPSQLRDWIAFQKRNAGKYTRKQLSSLWRKQKGGSRARRNASALELDTPGSFLASDPWHPVYEQVLGQFSTDEAFTHGLQPVNRRNPRRRRKSRR